MSRMERLKYEWWRHLSLIRLRTNHLGKIQALLLEQVCGKFAE